MDSRGKQVGRRVKDRQVAAAERRKLIRLLVSAYGGEIQCFTFQSV